MRPKRSTPKIMHQAGELRHIETPAEKKLWQYLRKIQLGNVRFRRQHAIDRYIVDFCAPNVKFIIELDGSQHIDQETYDMERTTFLESQGYRVLRFWNSDVMNDIDGVIKAIEIALSE